MTFNSLGIAISGMHASQVGLDVTGNNIANTNTVGYTRKVVYFEESVVSESPGISTQRFFSGASVENVRRIRDAFLDQQVRTQSSNAAYEKAVSDLTISMNDILGEPSDAGLTSKLNKFFQAAKDLATNPELQTARTVFVNSASALADSFNQIDQSINILKSNLDATPTGKIDSVISQLNAKLEELAEVHQEVLAADGRGVIASELEDKRDLLLDEISSFLDLNIERDGNGKLNKLTILSNSSEAKVTASLGFLNLDSDITDIVDGANKLTLSINNGNGEAVGPFDVNFETNSTMRDVVDKINRTFKAAGGKGNIASVDNSGQLVLSTHLIDNSANNDTAEIVIDGDATLLTTLGLSAGTTNGVDPVSTNVLDSQGVHYLFDLESGNLDTDAFATNLILRENNGALPKVGSIDSFGGELGGYFRMTNHDIPDMRKSLSGFAMSLKKAVNDIMSLGRTASGNYGEPLFTGDTAADFAVNTDILSNSSLLAQGKTGAASDGAIAEEVADLFFGNNNIISDASRSEMIFIDSPSSSSVMSTLPIIPGSPITIHIDGIVDDNGSAVNAGTNGFGGGSMVQIEFLDSSGNVIGGTIDFPDSAGAPEDRVSYNDTIPADAAFVRFVMNSATFNDNDLANNEGHFKISIIQGEENDSAINLGNRISDIVGDFGTRGNISLSKKENAENLYASLNNRRQSVIGVSLEEEASELIRYQNTFAANAKVLSVVNEVLQTLVNMI